MSERGIFVVGVIVAFAVLVPSATADEPSPLTDEDRRAIHWFDGIGLPSSAGKPYVRIRWVAAHVTSDTPEPADVWELDGFVVSERDGLLTVLDADLWPRRVHRTPSQGWTGNVSPVDLGDVAQAAISRLRAIREDPGAVESIDDLFRGLRLRFGDEGVAVAFASHCAHNGLEREAHELLEAARALPRRAGERKDAPIEEIAAAQIGESVIWRILFDFSAPSIPRSRLLERLRSWRKSFPASPHVARADEALRVLEPMVAEDADHPAVSDAALASLSPAERARELVYRLRDQPGDVFMTRQGRVTIDTRGPDTPAGQLLAMGRAAVPALVEAVPDARFTRAVLFIQDTTFSRQVVARVGDVARVVLERITGKESWDVPRDAPSMFQHGAAAQVQKRWREMLAPAEEFVAALRALASESDPRRRRELVSALPDRGSGPLPGAPDAVWGTKGFAAAIPGIDDDDARDLLRLLLSHAPHPRTQALAAWALLDLDEPHVVADAARLWRDLQDTAREDPEQGGALISFLAACGDPTGIAALAEGLDGRPAAVRELVVLAFADAGLGAVRGLAADLPEGVPVRWPTEEAILTAIEDLLAGRLGDLEEDPLGRIPRQTPMCDLVPEYDSGYRIADAAVRVLARRWPTSYPAPDVPVRTDEDWEALRTKFLATWQAARAESKPR